MNAVEFVKKFGWDVAITDLCNHEKQNTRSILYIYDDLKRLVESYELVESVGGWNNATALYDEYLDKDLGRAIADVEKCQ